MKNFIVSVTTMAVAMGMANAATIITSFGPANNQAGPMFGQSATVNIGADTADGSITQTVYLTSFSLRQTNSTTGINNSDVSYLHVYDAFGVDGSADPTTIGNLVGVSNSTVDFSTTGAGVALAWTFDGTIALDKSTEYFFIFAKDTSAATVGNSGNLITQGLRLTTANPYLGGRSYRANGTTSDWDAEFTMITSTNVVPEPCSTALMGLGGLAILLRRRR